MVKFIDEAKIWIKAGDGGDGCVAFRREKYIPKGGPSGGNGGKGGDVILRVVKDIHTLIDFHYRQHFKASKGRNGEGSNKDGRSGENLIIPVPVGTIVSEIKESNEIFIVDLSKDGMEYTVARGGMGGKGNASFKSSINQAPRKATPGETGEDKRLKLELKLLADVGIVGYPNSGKSTLISKVSSARPKIADYPFTTLSPNLGVVDLGDSRSFVIADIPGLIEKAAEGKGLGHKFLRHIERTKVLIHIIDLSVPDALERYYNIKKELGKYSKKLDEKTEIIAGNKIDLEESRENIKTFKKTFSDILFISALTNKGVKELMEAVWRMVDEYRAKSDEGKV